LLWGDYWLAAKLFWDRHVCRDWSAQESEQAFPKLGGLRLQDRICQRGFSMAAMNWQADLAEEVEIVLFLRSEIGVLRKLF
jgi:hypothetical protein